MKQFFLGVVLTLVTLIVLAVAFSYSGLYNVAASKPHSALGQWYLDNTMRHSVRLHASAIHAPQRFTSEQSHAGFEHYTDMCFACHSAPGIHTESEGDMRPEPPPLWSEAKHWGNGELFWIIKNGVKMTGMPAFGKTHSDDDIWNLVAFLRAMPMLPPAAFNTMVQRNSGDVQHSVPNHGGALQNHEQHGD